MMVTLKELSSIALLVALFVFRLDETDFLFHSYRCYSLNSMWLLASATVREKH